MELVSRLLSKSTGELSFSERLLWKLWLQRSQTRRQLKVLLDNDPELLMRDLGIHPKAAQSECEKWFWQA